VTAGAYDKAKETLQRGVEKVGGKTGEADDTTTTTQKASTAVPQGLDRVNEVNKTPLHRQDELHDIPKDLASGTVGGLGGGGANHREAMPHDNVKERADRTIENRSGGGGSGLPSSTLGANHDDTTTTTKSHGPTHHHGAIGTARVADLGGATTGRGGGGQAGQCTICVV